MKARELAYFALIGFEKEYIEDFFAKIQVSDPRDLKLAKEIAYGTVRRLKTLEYWAKLLSSEGKLNLKRKEKLLLFSALYQHVFLNRVPAFAINDETIKLAKKHFGIRCSQFINAILRKTEGFSFPMPEDLETAHSYPAFFIESLRKEYGEKTEEILKAMNHQPKYFVRDRKLGTSRSVDESELAKASNEKAVYIQNKTPIELLSSLAKDFHPKSILDLCASPGGKLLHAHDLFPDSEVFANDVSEMKCRLLRENLEKYEVEAEVFCGKGEEISFDRKFDLIIVDAPCSNSGVLHKRAEARWRLTPENLAKLREQQLAILKNAIR
ncbi:MAG TPA: transcription antitermination factor NusB, partial [Chlamydiales bacterium]|nr:transcription antitermination factor NusB [Chlamydiales bacterium]